MWIHQSSVRRGAVDTQHAGIYPWHADYSGAAACLHRTTGRGREIFASGQRWVTETFSWFYLLAVAIFLIMLIVIAMSRFGDIRLGADDERPEFAFASWLAMLFAAGMGIGLLYLGVAEPMMCISMRCLWPAQEHRGSAREAMLSTFFHWGFHAWRYMRWLVWCWPISVFVTSFRLFYVPVYTHCFGSAFMGRLDMPSMYSR